MNERSLFFAGLGDLGPILAADPCRMVCILESANASCRANKFTHIIQGNQEWQMFSQKLKLIHHASIHPVHFGKFSHPRISQIVENIFFV